jgi:hypothetical protein
MLINIYRQGYRNLHQQVIIVGSIMNSIFRSYVSEIIIARSIMLYASKIYMHGSLVPMPHVKCLIVDDLLCC